MFRQLGLRAHRAIIAFILVTTFWLGSAARAAELKNRQATIKGMVVIQMPDGKLSGKAVGIVATAGQAKKGGALGIRGKIGDQMKSALDEAERYVRVANADLCNADISVSFEERYSPKDGGSAGTAFTVLLKSMIEGFAIDPAVAVTGDISVNGKVMPIGGVTAKLLGAIADGCTIAVVPTENVPAVGDLFVRGDQMVEVMRGIQVISASTVEEAIAAVRSDRDAKLIEAIKLFGEVQDDVKKKGIGALRTPAAQQKLAKGVELAPNHVSGKYALDIAKGKGPRTLTRNGSLVEVWAATWPFREVVIAEKGKKITRDALPAATMRAVRNDLVALKRITHPDVEKVRGTLQTWVETIDALLANGDKPISESDARVVTQRRDALVKELKRLDTDEALLAKMMREGY